MGSVIELAVGALASLAIYAAINYLVEDRATGSRDTAPVDEYDDEDSTGNDCDDDNEISTTCGSKCDTVDSCKTGQPCPYYHVTSCYPIEERVCNCKPGYSRVIGKKSSRCVKNSKCEPLTKCPRYEKLTSCGDRCDHVDTCTNDVKCPYVKDTECYPSNGTLVCNCQKGYFRIGVDGRCVSLHECRGSLRCTKNEILTLCGSKCDALDTCTTGRPCPYFYDLKCYPTESDKAVEVCNCDEGYRRAIFNYAGKSTSVCLPEDSCADYSDCPLNEVLTSCGSRCDHVDTCLSGKSCVYDDGCFPPANKVVCNCRPGYSRVGEDGPCVPDLECQSITKCQTNEILTPCGSKCDRVDSCRSGQPCPYYDDTGCYPLNHTEMVCNCKPGFARDMTDPHQGCVPRELCKPYDKCPNNEYLTPCGSKCDHFDQCLSGESCPHREDKSCYPLKPFNVVCNCYKGYFRLGANGHCVSDVECRSYTRCKENETLTTCGSICDSVDSCSTGRPCPYSYNTDCYPQLQSNADICNCKSGYKRVIKENKATCVAEAECKAYDNCPENEVLTSCGSKCDHFDVCQRDYTCPFDRYKCFPPDHTQVCNCRKGYVRHGDGGKCIPEIECKSIWFCHSEEQLTICGSRCDDVDSCTSGRPCPYYYDKACYPPNGTEVCNCKPGFTRIIKDDMNACVLRNICKTFDDCPANEVLTKCGSKCDHVDECLTGTPCPYKGNKTCYPPNPDSVVCNCMEGYSRFGPDGHCVPDVECRSYTRCKENELLTTCGSRCDSFDSCQTGRPCPYYYDTECYVVDQNSTKEVCNCKQGYKRVITETENRCVPMEKCKEFDDCPENEVLTNCGSKCDHVDECLTGTTCPYKGNKTCYPPNPDIVVCNCMEGYFRFGPDGHCVPDVECRSYSRCKENELLTSCGSRCDSFDSCLTGTPCPYYYDTECYVDDELSTEEVCNCKPGYKRVIDETESSCVVIETCKEFYNCPQNEVLTNCGSICDHVDECVSGVPCSDRGNETCYPPKPDNVVCNCKHGYYRFEADGDCIPDVECRSYSRCKENELLTSCGSRCDPVDSCMTGRPCPYSYDKECYPESQENITQVCNCKSGYKRVITGTVSSCVPIESCKKFDDCPENEVLTDCGSKCDHVDECLSGVPCPDRGNETCYPPKPDNVVCNCKLGYHRLGNDGECIPDIKCRSITRCKENEILTTCGSRCDSFDSCQTGRPCPYYYDTECYVRDIDNKDMRNKGANSRGSVEVCNCKHNYKRVIYGTESKCIPEDSCKVYDNCPENEVLTECGSKCDHVDECLSGVPCPDRGSETCYPPKPDNVVCNCKHGYHRLGDDGECIPDIECRSITRCNENEILTSCGSRCDSFDSCQTGRPCPYYYDTECYVRDIDNKDMGYADNVWNIEEGAERRSSVEICNCKQNYKRVIYETESKCIPEDSCKEFDNCPKDEVLTDCGLKCDHVDECLSGVTCPYRGNHTCYPPEPYNVVCNCIDGFFRFGPDGHCIPDIECRSHTRCKENEILTTCGSRCDSFDSCQTGQPCPYFYDKKCYAEDKQSTEETCNCKQGYKRVNNGTDSSCVPNDVCKEFHNCPDNEILTKCGSKCDHVDECITGRPCPYTGDVTCYPPDPDNVVCNCMEGYSRFGPDGYCVPDVECRSYTRCKENELLTSCGSRCDPVDSCMTGRPCPYSYDKECYPESQDNTTEVCNCKSGYTRVINGTDSKCVPIDSCKDFDDCPENEVLTDCGSICDHVDECLSGVPCPDRGSETCYPPKPDNVVCNCKHGYHRLGNDGDCIPDIECRSITRCNENEILTSCGSRCDSFDSCQTGRPCPYYYDTECYVRDIDNKDMGYADNVWNIEEGAERRSSVEICNCKQNYKRVIYETESKCIPEDSCKEFDNCPKDEVLTDCGLKCDHVDECLSGVTCPYRGNHTCYPPEPNNVVCNCIDGFFRFGPDGHCIPDIECRSYTRCKENEILTTCGSRCDSLDSCQTGRPCPYYYDTECYVRDIDNKDMGYADNVWNIEEGAERRSSVEICNCKKGYKRVFNGTESSCVSKDDCHELDNCPDNEVLTKCGSKCDHVDECITGRPCPYTGDVTCYPPDPDDIVCNCMEGYSRFGPDGYCVPDVECRSYTRCKENELLTSCGSRCDPVDSCMTGRPCPYSYDKECYPESQDNTTEVCNCISGYTRVINETDSSCVPIDSCKEFDNCPENEVLTDCGLICDHVDECLNGVPCPDRGNETCFPPKPDNVVCNCKDEYYRLGNDGDCIPYEDCRSASRCKRNETLTLCGSRCDGVDSCSTGRPCPYYYDKECFPRTLQLPKYEVCNCKPGFKRVIDGDNSTCEPEEICIPYDNCPENEELKECGSTCDMHTGKCLFNHKCRVVLGCFDNGGEKVCNCIPEYIRYHESDMRCVSEADCKAERDVCWSLGCGSKCDYYDACTTGRPCPFYDDPSCHHKGSENIDSLHICLCQPGYRRVIRKYSWTVDLLTCIPENECVPYYNCPEYEELTNCGKKCDHSDSCLTGQPCPDENYRGCHPPYNVTVCNCIDGYRRYGMFGSCVPEEKCNKIPTQINQITETPSYYSTPGCYYMDEMTVDCGRKSDVTVQCNTGRPSPFLQDQECYPSKEFYANQICNCKEGFIRKRGYECSRISWCRPFIDTNCNANEKLVSCGSRCDYWDSCQYGEPCPYANDKSCWPKDGVLVCNCKTGYTRYGLECVPVEDCDFLKGICPINEHLSTCGNPCDDTICDEGCWWSKEPCYPKDKKNVCNCLEGYVRESHMNPVCVEKKVRCTLILTGKTGDTRLRTNDVWSYKGPRHIVPDARRPTRFNPVIDWKRLFEGRRESQVVDDV